MNPEEAFECGLLALRNDVITRVSALPTDKALAVMVGWYFQRDLNRLDPDVPISERAKNTEHAFLSYGDAISRIKLMEV